MTTCTGSVVLLAASLQEHGLTSEEMRGADGIAWLQAAKLAGVSFPDAAERAAVIERMAGIEADQRAEGDWEDAQEYAGNRCSPRE